MGLSEEDFKKKRSKLEVIILNLCKSYKNFLKTDQGYI